MQNVVVLNEKNQHTRSARDGPMFKLHVNSGVGTVDMWIGLVAKGPVFSW